MSKWGKGSDGRTPLDISNNPSVPDDFFKIFSEVTNVRGDDNQKLTLNEG